MNINENLKKIFDLAVERKASDIHLTANLQPTLRIDGVLTPLEDFPLNTKEILEDFVQQLLTEDKMEKFEEEKELDTSISYETGAAEDGSIRFRVHVFKQSGFYAVVLRLIPTKIPKFKDLGIPPVVKKFATLPNGLVLITGITGSGKSTTLASLIDEINRNYSKHIVTVEDPIEFIHKHRMSIVNQREIGSDVKDFPRAVRAAMREDPDILLVGEMRDLETIQNAITMAETGHLVFGTLHTKSAAETISRIIDIFPPEQQSQIRTQLASSIKGIVSQNLIPKIDGGRIPSCEVLVINPAIQSMIRENSNTSSILDQIQMKSKELGSQTHLQSLAKLLVGKKITLEVAKSGLTTEEIQVLNGLVVAESQKDNKY